MKLDIVIGTSWHHQAPHNEDNRQGSQSVNSFCVATFKEQFLGFNRPNEVKQIYSNDRHCQTVSVLRFLVIRIRIPANLSIGDVALDLVTAYTLQSIHGDGHEETLR